MLDQTFDRLQKLVSQLELLEEKLSQEDVNQKLLRINTAQAVNTAHEVSTASTQVNVAYSKNIDNLSDDVICSFFASQQNSPQLVHEDLKQGVQSSKKSRQQAQEKLKKECDCGNIYFYSFGVMYGIGGYDWSDQAKEGPNYALMALSSLSSDS
nr:hypothetical protein [Tanacetum cinerariifolium]